jgi:hypothetical protein
MHPIIRMVLVFILALLSAGGTIPGEQPSPSPAKLNSGPTPLQQAALSLEVPSAATSLREFEASVTKIQSNADAIDGRLSKLIDELDGRMVEDTRLLSASPPPRNPLSDQTRLAKP